MRQLTVLSLILLLSGFAAAQATVVGGYASTWTPSYGVYAAPFVPRVITPSVSLQSISPSPVGASNATFGNVAGATNATLSIVTDPPVGVYTVPVWYGPNASSPAVVAPLMLAAEGQPEAAMETGGHARSAGFSGGMQYDESVIKLMASEGAGKKATRTYTNQDVDRFNQSTGQVKYDGKTEQIH